MWFSNPEIRLSFLKAEMKTTPTILAILLTAGTAAYAQVEPAATGPGVPLPGGNLNYSAHYSQTAEFGSYVSDYQTSNISADLDYANGKERHPFSLDYGGGYTFTITGPSYQTGLFQHLFVSQGYVWRKWNMTASDDVSYRPQAPITGFSGVPGTGEPIGGTNPSPPTSQSILTVNTHVVDNLVNGELDHRVGFATSLSAGGSYELLRYPDGNGLDYNTDAANAGLSQRLNARNTLTANYQFSLFTYPVYSFSLMTNSGMLGFNRDWSRKINTVISAGPQWTENPDSKTPPLQIGVAANVTATYKYRLESASLNYTRGVNSGGGYLLGAESDAVSGSFSQDFGKSLTVGLSGSYRHTAGIENSPLGQSANEVITSEFGGVQATRRLGRYLTFFAGYTAIQQSTTSTLATNVLNGLQQVVNFGVGYSPREMHLKQ
jgi:hypothetical protein